LASTEKTRQRQTVIWNTKTLQHKINTKNYSQVWSPHTTSWLETEQALFYIRLGPHGASSMATHPRINGLLHWQSTMP